MNGFLEDIMLPLSPFGDLWDQMLTSCWLHLPFISQTLTPSFIRHNFSPAEIVDPFLLL